MSVFFCIASGPSLCAEDVDAVRGRGTVIAVNNAVQLAPWADVLYACDQRWWLAYRDLWSEFGGERVSCQPENAAFGARIVAKENGDGLGLQGVRTGGNSGHQALNLAYLRGATTVILLGYDMQHGADGRAHCHPDHPAGMSNFPESVHGMCIASFGRIARDLRAQGMRVINCTRSTALHCFERMPIADALAQIETRAAA